MPYINYSLNKIKNTSLEFEYAYSNDQKDNGSAYRIAIVSKINKLSAGINYVYSSPNFRGYLNNTKNLNGNINYRLSKKANISLNHFQNSKNEQLDTLLFSAPLFKQSQLGFDYKYAKNGQITLFNGYMKNEDQLANNLFKYEEYFIKQTIAQKIGFLHLDFSNQFGYTKNYLTNTKGNSSIQNLNLNITKFNGNLSVFGTIANTYRYEANKTKNFYYGARIDKNIGNRTLVNFYYQSNYIPEEYYRERSQFEGSINHTYKNHSFSLSGRYFVQRGQIGNQDFIAALTYKTTLQVPIKKIHNYSTLNGNIKNDKENLKGIRVQLGNNYAITDKNGNYVFKNVSPGNYYIDIDRSTLPIDDVSTWSLPNEITIENKELNQQNFEITKAASIKGSIKFLDVLNASITSKEYQTILESNIIIEISDKYKTTRKVCQLNKPFEFTYLQPGQWTIKIYSNQLNKNLKIENDFFEFELTAGEEKNLVIRVKSNQKEVFMQQESIKVGYINKK